MDAISMPEFKKNKNQGNGGAERKYDRTITQPHSYLIKLIYNSYPLDWYGSPCRASPFPRSSGVNRNYGKN